MAEIMFPIGRMVGGSMYVPNLRTDDNNQPVIGKDGQQEKSYSFGLAIKKNGEQNWAQTPWGAQVRQIGETAYPGQCLAPSFSWKITDGDSQIPNKKNKRPCDQEGYAGHWVIWFNQNWAPKLVDAKGIVELTETDAIVPGYFIEVYGQVEANKPRPGKSHTPGVYMNPLAVALAGYGNRIVTSSIDTTAVGFGRATPPPGVSTVPVSEQLPHHPSPPPPPPAPNAAFLKVPVKTMTELAGGASYETFIAQGWTDEQMVQNGYMTIS